MSDDPSASTSADANRQSKRPWEPPRLAYEGSTGELIQQGSKSGVTGDPGDTFKESGTEPK